MLTFALSWAFAMAEGHVARMVDRSHRNIIWTWRVLVSVLGGPQSVTYQDVLGEVPFRPPTLKALPGGIAQLKSDEYGA